MALKTLVAVTNINNLSDARYCAGMGADIISFCLTEGKEGFLKPTEVKEIAGWLAGVQFAGEFEKVPVETINEIAQSCALDMVQLNSTYFLDDIVNIELPIIQRILIDKDTIETDLMEMLALYQSHVDYFLLDSKDFEEIDETNIQLLKDLANEFPILLGFGLHKENVFTVLENINPRGLALKGGHEIKPGLKNFDELADILELLEE
ncbi:hypothetical protein [Adhaeribacter aquaticus]|uniref:phosphoribosylanthranilate isomerase n=1 Tax=Adhaeribacter aquaticus TaxID=299567 RepID=UPI000478B5C5|nr:hypothetical protein [Adhaeribacter aquaticus]